MRNLPRWFARLLTPFAILSGYSGCSKCRISWAYIEPHITEHEDGSGIGSFALCELCWSQLTPQERVSYYRHVHGECEEWPLIEQQVLAGK
jgi:hypothetical protein